MYYTLREALHSSYGSAYSTRYSQTSVLSSFSWFWPMSDSEDASVLGKRAHEEEESRQEREETTEEQPKAENAEDDDDDDDDFGPMPLPAAEKNGAVKKKRKGASVSN